MEPEKVAQMLSEEDSKWMEQTIPPHFHPIVLRHGRALFQIVFQAGLIGEALQRIAQQGRGNRAIQTSVAMIAQASDLLCRGALKSVEATVEHFAECKQDIERIAALTDAGQHKAEDRISKGGIILNS